MTGLYIISGFLGSGKTTLIQTMIRSVFKDKKVVVVENDFGEAGIDAGLLRECNLEVASLSAGCICCSLTGDFKRAVEQMAADYMPDAILVEPSGVGKLSDIVKACLSLEDQGKLCLKRTVTVVDIRSFDKYRKNYGEFYKDQIAYADLILLSHQEECPDKIQGTEKKLKELNPEARIEADFWESIPGAVFRHVPRNSNILKLELEAAVTMKPMRIRSVARPGRGQKAGFFRSYFAGEVFSSVTLEWNDPVAEEELGRRVLNVVKHADGEILRGKGIVCGKETVRKKGIVPDGAPGLVFHFTPGSLHIEPTRAVGNQLCFIGTGLDRQQIQTLFNEGK